MTLMLLRKLNLMRHDTEITVILIFIYFNSADSNNHKGIRLIYDNNEQQVSGLKDMFIV
jgi:hypothetical protein